MRATRVRVRWHEILSQRRMSHFLSASLLRDGEGYHYFWDQGNPLLAKKHLSLLLFVHRYMHSKVKNRIVLSYHSILRRLCHSDFSMSQVIDVRPTKSWLATLSVEERRIISDLMSSFFSMRSMEKNDFFSHQKRYLLHGSASIRYSHIFAITLSYQKNTRITQWDQMDSIEFSQIGMHLRDKR